MSHKHESPETAPELEPQLEAAVRAVLSSPLNADAVERVKARAGILNSEISASAMYRVDVSDPQEVLFPTLSRSFVVKSLSTVAGIVVLVGAIMLLQSSPSAFAEAIKQLRNARSCTFTKQIYTEGTAKPIMVKTLVAEDGRQRLEQAGETITIMDASSQVRLTLLGLTKTAIVSEAGQPPAVPRNHPLDWLETLKAHGDQPEERLGRKMLDGRSAEGFVAKQGQTAYTIWVDVGTKELMQVEYEFPVKGSSISKIVLTDFRFNEKLDETLFRFDVPEGYKTMQRRTVLPKSVGGETSIMEALRGYAKRSGGKFPKSISDWGEWAVLFSRGSSEGQVDQETGEVLAHLGSILPFLTTLSKDDYQYLGSGISTEDARCIVFWYRNQSGVLRAIYNDFSVADVTEKDLP